jgi:dynein light chain 4, axonemal
MYTSGFLRRMASLTKAQLQQPVIAMSDIPGDMRTEVLDLVVAGMDKYGSNLEVAARSIKDTLDKQYGVSWQVIMGQGFGFDITSLESSVLHCYYQGEVGVLVYKS